MSPDSPPVCPIQTATSVGLPQDKVPGKQQESHVSNGVVQTLPFIVQLWDEAGRAPCFLQRDPIVGLQTTLAPQST